jgi:biotin operon repressor
MNLANQMKADINFNKIVSQLQREFSSGKSQVFIDSNLLENNIQRLRDEGFQVNTDGYQYNGGAYISFKIKNQWR